MAIGNWRDRRMVERYMHLGDETLAAAMETLDGLVNRGGLSQSPVCHSGSDARAEEPAVQVAVN